MREDMGKVLVERPRWGSRARSRPGKGYRKRLAKCLAAGESPPAREGMKARYTNRKFFNEHLGPLRRFLDSNVGRPWDKVYAEICKHVDRGNVVQKHILTHLFEYVAVHTVLIAGEPCHGKDNNFRGRYGDSLRTSLRRHQWYVCPKSGILRKSRYTPWRKVVPVLHRRVVLGNGQVCLQVNGQWELVTFARLSGLSELRVYDVIRKRWVGRSGGCDDEAIRFYGEDVYAVSRRPLSRREQRNLPIPIDWQK
jgi:hypothetical protein